eukprot:XP_017946056.1 PREDICTED: lamina-associated polypeptide 2, isoforms alpha/zeta-like [Xenopus tropicalis]
MHTSSININKNLQHSTYIHVSLTSRGTQGPWGHRDHGVKGPSHQEGCNTASRHHYADAVRRQDCRLSYSAINRTLRSVSNAEAAEHFLSMAEGRGDLFSRGGKHHNPVATFFACTKCLTKFREGQAEPLCAACGPTQAHNPGTLTLSQVGVNPEGTAQGPSARDILEPQRPSETPDWAISLSQSLSSLQCIPQLASSLDRMLSKMASTSDAMPKRKRPCLTDTSLKGSSTLPSSDEDISDGEIVSSPADSDSSEGDNAADTAPGVDSLIRAVLETLNIQEDPTQKKSSTLFKRQRKSPATFPAHEQLQNLILEEWKCPDRKFQVTKHFARQYPFPKESIDKWCSPPAVDAPVSRLSKITALPVPDASAFKDPADKRMEGLLKANFLSTGSAMRPILASAWVSRAVETWSNSLVQAIQDDSPKDTILQLASYIQEANQFLADASLDAARVIARASALSVAIRRALWLKLWSADLSSKKSLISIPFQGQRLFGELDKIISQATGGKSTLLPQNKPKSTFTQRKGQPFRNQGFRNFRSSPQSNSQSTSKNRFSNKGKSPWQPRRHLPKQTGDKTTSA